MARPISMHSTYINLAESWLQSSFAWLACGEIVKAKLARAASEHYFQLARRT